MLFDRRLIFVIGLSLTTSDGFARFLTMDESGNSVEIKSTETPIKRFQRTYSLEDFQQLDSTDRAYAVPEALLSSLDPNSNLTRDQRTRLKHVLSQYYETMPQIARESIERKVFWMAFLSGNPSLVRNAAEKFLSPYPDIRERQLCNLVRDSTQMVLYTNEKPTIHYLMKLGTEPMEVLATLIESNKQIGNEKCALGETDAEPLSLKEMRAEIIKAGLVKESKESKKDVRSEMGSRPKTECLVSTIKSTFADAIASIEKGGANTKVYLGINSMACPIYGLVVRDPKSNYRYYPDTYREDIVPGIQFKNADDIANMFQIVPNSQITKPSKTTKGVRTSK